MENKDEIRTVLCYLEQDGKYLMLLRNKHHDDMNEGKWLGVGGHIEKGETPDDALLREVWEETGLVLSSFLHRGILHFINDDYEETMYLYTSDSFTGKLKECDEGTLRWISKNEIMGLRLWDGDRVFLKKLIEEAKYMFLNLYYHKGEFIRSEEIDIPAVFEAKTE